MGWGCRVLWACNWCQIQLSFISIHKFCSLWSIESPTLLTLSSSSVITKKKLIWVTDFTILIQVIVPYQPLQPHKPDHNQPHLPHPAHHQFTSSKSHITNLISFVHPTATDLIQVLWHSLYLSLTKSLSLSLLFSQLAAITTKHRYWRNTS